MSMFRPYMNKYGVDIQDTCRIGGLVKHSRSLHSQRKRIAAMLDPSAASNVMKAPLTRERVPNGAYSTYVVP